MDPYDRPLSCNTSRTLNYGNYGIFLIMGNAGFTSSTVVLPLAHSSIPCYEPGRYIAGCWGQQPQRP